MLTIVFVLSCNDFLLFLKVAPHKLPIELTSKCRTFRCDDVLYYFDLRRHSYAIFKDGVLTMHCLELQSGCQNVEFYTSWCKCLIVLAFVDFQKCDICNICPCLNWRPINAVSTISIAKPFSNVSIASELRNLDTQIWYQNVGTLNTMVCCVTFDLHPDIHI